MTTGIVLLVLAVAILLASPLVWIAWCLYQIAAEVRGLNEKLADVGAGKGSLYITPCQGDEVLVRHV